MVAIYKKESLRFRHNTADIHDHKVTIKMVNLVMVVTMMMIFETKMLDIVKMESVIL